MLKRFLSDVKAVISFLQK